VRRVESTGFVILTLTYREEFDLLYGKLFGDNAKNDEQHKENYDCAQNFHQKLDSIVKNFESDIKAFIQLGEKGLAKDIVNQHGHGIVREKRSVVAGTALIMGLLNLALSSTSIIVSELNSAQLFERISALEAQIDQDALRSTSIGKNVQLLKNEDDILALHVNKIYESFESFAYVHACDLQALSFNSLLLDAARNFDKMRDALFSGYLTPEILNVKALTQIFEHTDIFKGSIYSSTPSLLYKKSHVVVLGITDNKNLSLLITYPNLRSKIEYVAVELFSLPVLEQFQDTSALVWHEYGVQRVLLKFREGLSLSNLTRKDIFDSKSDEGCTFVGNEIFCSEFRDLRIEVKLCLIELIFGVESATKKSQFCQQKVVPIKGSNEIRYMLTGTGLLIVHPASTQILARGVIDQNFHTVSHSNDLTDVWQCSFIGESYNLVQINSPNQTATNISLLRSFSTTKVIGPDSSTGVIQISFHTPNHSERINFEGDKLFNMNRTIVDHGSFLAHSYMTYLTLGGGVLGFVALIVVLVCLCKRNRLSRNLVGVTTMPDNSDSFWRRLQSDRLNSSQGGLEMSSM
jgi:hypothetical protein